MLCVNKRCWYFWLWYFTKWNRFRYSKSIRVDIYISTVSPPAPLRKDFSRQFDWWVLFLHQVQWIKKKRKKRKTQIPFQSLTAQRSESVFKKSSGSEVCRAFSQEKETNSPSLLQNFDDLDLRFIPWLSLFRQAVCLRSRTVWLRPLMHFDDS